MELARQPHRHGRLIMSDADLLLFLIVAGLALMFWAAAEIAFGDRRRK